MFRPILKNDNQVQIQFSIHNACKSQSNNVKWIKASQFSGKHKHFSHYPYKATSRSICRQLAECASFVWRCACAGPPFRTQRLCATGDALSTFRSIALWTGIPFTRQSTTRAIYKGIKRLAAPTLKSWLDIKLGSYFNLLSVLSLYCRVFYFFKDASYGQYLPVESDK